MFTCQIFMKDGTTWIVPWDAENEEAEGPRTFDRFEEVVRFFSENLVSWINSANDDGWDTDPADVRGFLAIENSGD